MAGETSGTTATLVVVDGWTVTVASVGDSRCILDSQDGVVSLLTVDHRLEENVEERERVTASGGEVGRLNICGGKEVLVAKISDVQGYDMILMSCLHCLIYVHAAS